VIAASERFQRDTARIVVRVNGVEHTGWIQSEVVRSMEAIAGTFSVPVSMVAGSPPSIARGDRVQVLIGKTQVINGYVLAAEPFYKRGDCGLRVTGRDRTGDLVRSSAMHRGGQWRKARLDRIARDLLAPFGVDVMVEADLGAPLNDFKLWHGESVLDALARAARLRGVLVTRDDAGRLLLTTAGLRAFHGEVRRGWNVIEMSGIGSDEERHSEYIVYGQSNTAADFETARGLKARALDPGVRRYLPLIVNADGNVTAAELQSLAEHTMRVRRGHSLGLRYVVEGWTFAGEAWPLNHRVRVFDDIAGLDGDEWLIASVRQTCDLREGDVTELVLRPPEAYDRRPLRSKPVRRNWLNKGNTTNHPRGPSDKARSGP
jgi:prophage tail gpP-like protein